MLVECFREISSAFGGQRVFAGFQIVKNKLSILTHDHGAEFIALGDRRNGYLGPCQGRAADGIHYHAADLPFFFFYRGDRGSVLLLRDCSQRKQANTISMGGNCTSGGTTSSSRSRSTVPHLADCMYLSLLFGMTATRYLPGSMFPTLQELGSSRSKLAHIARFEGSMGKNWTFTS